MLSCQSWCLPTGVSGGAVRREGDAQAAGGAACAAAEPQVHGDGHQVACKPRAQGHVV